MNLIKVKGIVIKEISFKENDKIITLLTDNLGKISCIARGAKKTNSMLLACSQFLVYSEFVLFKGKSFYYINSATIIDTFYNLRIDFDKLQIAFELSKLVISVTDENVDTSTCLKLFLNTMFVIQNEIKNLKLVVATFKIKLFSILGFRPMINSCSSFSKNISEIEDKYIYYDFVSNVFICDSCSSKFDKNRLIKIKKSTLIAIKYVIYSDIKKVFSFELKDISDFSVFGQVYAETMLNGI